MTKARVMAIGLVCVMPSLVMAQQAAIDTGSVQTQFGGTANFACLASTPQGTQTTGARFSATGSVAQVAFDTPTVIDPNTLIAREFSVTLSVPVTCNGAHSVSVRSARGGMQLQTPIAQAIGLSSRIDMDINAGWLGETGRVSTLGLPIGFTLNKNDGASGLVEVTVSGKPGTNPLVAGRYSDEIIIDLAALQ